MQYCHIMSSDTQLYYNLLSFLFTSTEINECSEELDLKPCGHNKENGTFGTCTDQKGTYTCDCNQGYKEANQARQTDRKWGDFVGNVAEGPTCESNCPMNAAASIELLSE